jgi:membrane-associated protein
MELIRKFIDLVLHLDRHLEQMTQTFGPWIYVILFVIVFCETGLVVTPFLPGDSLLFATGAIAALPESKVGLVPAMLVMLVAAILGDSVNYAIGKAAGNRLAARFPRLIQRRHIDKTHEFFERYGGKAIVIARFVPIVRTFAPFVAGIGSMTYRRFMFFNVSGALLWVLLLTPAGYFFANIPIVKQNFSTVILGIIFVSILPAVIEVFREWRKSRQSRQAQGG